MRHLEAVSADAGSNATPSDLPVALFGAPKGQRHSKPLRRRNQTEMLKFARDLHDTVVQRLCGLSLVLGSEWDSPDEHRALCGSEVTSALNELQQLIDLNLAGAQQPSGSVAASELALLRAAHSPQVVFGFPDSLPALSAPLRRLMDTTLAEALRNAAKHARPRMVTVAVTNDNGTVCLEVTNDGATTQAGRSFGLGIRLLEMEASLLGGVLECRAQTASSWSVRLTVPVGA